MSTVVRSDDVRTVKPSLCTLSCQRQRRHQRVKTWTRHVDIFQKDFLFVPVNQEWVNWWAFLRNFVWYLTYMSHISLLCLQGSLVFSRHLFSWTDGADIWGLERLVLADGKERRSNRWVTGTRVGSRIQKPKRQRRSVAHSNQQCRRKHRDR